MSLPEKSLPKKCQFNTKSYGNPYKNRWNSRTKSQVPINQIYTSTFDFEESISIIKTWVDDFNQEKIARIVQNIKIASSWN